MVRLRAAWMSAPWGARRRFRREPAGYRSNMPKSRTGHSRARRRSLRDPCERPGNLDTNATARSPHPRCPQTVPVARGGTQPHLEWKVEAASRSGRRGGRHTPAIEHLALRGQKPLNADNWAETNARFLANRRAHPQVATWPDGCSLPTRLQLGAGVGCTTAPITTPASPGMACVSG